MSRRDKQADLRRRMAEARAKLITSSHANASDLDNEIATDIPIKKRPLPSTGGILKKSKYSSSTPAVPPPPQTDTSKAKDDKSSDNNNVLGSLMADYGDSSDDDKATNTNTKAPLTSNTDDQKQSSEPIQPTTNNDIQQQMPNKKKKKKKKKKDKPQLEDTDDVDKTEAGQLKSKEEGNDKPTEVSDEVWDEFNALLDDDEVVAKESISLKSEDTNNSIPIQNGETSINSETTTTKKKKKKKGSKKKRDIYDNDDMNTVEQASYEARLARLMLLKSKKTQHKNSTNGDDIDEDKLLSASTNEFYNGGLAFQQDDEDDGSDAESKANATANLKSDGVEEAKDTDDTNTTTVSNTVASSISAPSVSLAAILRGRRDQARQLSRGNDKIDTANDNDEEEDESWF